MWVVYRHTCLVTGKSYIGFTKNGMMSEWHRRHVRNASIGKSFHLSNAIRKHGSECWTHEELESCSSALTAKEAEIKWIATFNSNDSEDGYNMTPGGDGITEHTPELLEKLRAATIAGMSNPKVRSRLREAQAIIQSDPDVAERRRLRNATADVKRHRSEAQLIAQNRPDVKDKQRKAQKLAQSKLDVNARRSVSIKTTLSKPDVQTKLREARACPERKQRHRDAVKVAVNKPETLIKKAKPIVQLTIDGEAVAMFTSPKEASRITGVNRGNLCSCARGELRQAGGFRWMFVDPIDTLA